MMASPPVLSPAVLDLNAHILPGIHGATPDIGASVDAARTLAGSGVLAAVTPALLGPNPGDDIARADVARRDLQRALADETVPLDLLPGAVIPFEAVAELDPDVLLGSTIGNGGRWVMVALPDAGWPLALPQALLSLEANRMGMVIAHPERSESVQIGRAHV